MGTIEAIVKDGVTYTLTSEPVSITLLADYMRVAWGDIFIHKWSANAVDKDGNKLKVVWEHPAIKGPDENEADNYDWSDPELITIVQI